MKGSIGTMRTTATRALWAVANVEHSPHHASPQLQLWQLICLRLREREDKVRGIPGFSKNRVFYQSRLYDRMGRSRTTPLDGGTGLSYHQRATERQTGAIYQAAETSCSQRTQNTFSSVFDRFLDPKPSLSLSHKFRNAVTT